MDAPDSHIVPSPLRADDAERRLHPWSWLFVLGQQLRQFIVPLVALMIFGGRGDRGDFWMGIGPVIAVGVLVVISVLQYFTYRYRVGKDGLTIRDGVLARNLREIPYSRIHNVVLHQSVLHRMFGVAEVRLESAGGQKPEAQMRVLRMDEALALESQVKHRGQMVDATVAAQEADSLLSLSTGEVIRLGLVSNRGMIVMAAAFGAAWQIFPDRVMTNLFEKTGRQIFGYASHLNLGWVTTAAAAVALIVLALLLLRGLSVLLALVQYHGFRLSEDQRRLTVQRGLLSKLRTSVARRRIQAWTLQEGFLHRVLKRRSLRIDTAVAEQQDQGGDSRALKELAPIATPDTCDALIQHLLPQAQWPRTEWNGLPVGAWWRLFMPSAIFVTLLTLVLSWYSANRGRCCRCCGCHGAPTPHASRRGATATWSTKNWWRYVAAGGRAIGGSPKSTSCRRFGCRVHRSTGAWEPPACGWTRPARVASRHHCRSVSCRTRMRSMLYRQLAAALARRKLQW